MSNTNYLAELYKKGEIKKVDNCRKAKTQEELAQILRQNLAHDSDLIRDAIKTSIIDPLAIDAISRADSNGQKCVPIFNILTNQKLFDLDFHSNMKMRTFFFGFWDSETNAYSDEKFTQAGKGLMLEELNKVIKPLKIVDISDPTLSKKYVLELRIPPNPDFPTIDEEPCKEDKEVKDDVPASSSDSTKDEAKTTDVTDIDPEGYVAVVKRGKKKIAVSK